MSKLADKKRVAELMADNKIDDLIEWAESVRNPYRILLSLVYDDDRNIRIRSIEVIGKCAALTAKNDIEKVRDLIRRQFWLMNDESGGIGWHAPEIIAEILINVPSLIDEFGVLLPSFLKEEPFELGTHQAILKVASVRPEPYRNFIPKFLESANCENPEIRSYAAKILEII